MSKPFDQREALGVLEAFGEGNFEDLMNYSFTDMWSFANAALDYISDTTDRNKFLIRLVDIFE